MWLSTDATVVLSVGTVGVLLLVPRTHLIDDLSRQMEMAVVVVVVVVVVVIVVVVVVVVGQRWFYWQIHNSSN